MKKIHIKASKEYDVLIGEGLLEKAGTYAAKICSPRLAAVITDDNVAPLYLEKLCASLADAGFDTVEYIFPAEEASKNLETYGRIMDHLAESKLSRTDLIVALGGGVAGDMAGFAAATFLRGVKYIQIPTTLLAAVDSSVGGKTAIDLNVGKNLAGAFYQPSLVLCDTGCLKTLPQDVMRAGCAEVIKYGMYGNKRFLREVFRTPVPEQLEHVISVCVRMKAALVEADEFDTGARRVLNFGHSFGHAIEAVSNYEIPHGYAVAIGMAMISVAAALRGYCGMDVPAFLLEVLGAYGLPAQCPCGADELLDALLSDKKMASGKMHLVVPTGIGSCEVISVPTEELREWLIDGGAA